MPSQLCSAVVVGLMLLAADGAEGQSDPFVVVARGGPPVSATISKIENAEVSLVAQGAPKPVVRAFAELAAVLPAEWWTPGDESSGSRRRLEAAALQCAAERAGLAVLELTTGERIIGTLEAGSGEPIADEVTFTHRLMGTRTYPLEAVRRIKPEGPPANANFPADKDAVALGNGDVLAGFIERVGGEVWIKPEGVTEVVRLPLAKVREMRFANPRAAAQGVMVWLDDGSIIACDPASINAGTRGSQGILAIRAVPAGAKEKELCILGSVRAILAGQGRAVPLAQMLPRTPAPDRVAARPPRVLLDADSPGGLVDIELPGPTTVEWSLAPATLAAEAPVSTGRVLGWLTLAEGAREWGDCVVTLSADDGPALIQARLNGASPVMAVDAPLPAGATVLRVTVDAGERGPVQDRVVLRRMLIVRP